MRREKATPSRMATKEDSDKEGDDEGGSGGDGDSDKSNPNHHMSTALCHPKKVERKNGGKSKKEIETKMTKCQSLFVYQPRTKTVLGIE